MATLSTGDGASTAHHHVQFRVLCDDESFSSLGVIGNTSALGCWDLSNMTRLVKVGQEEDSVGIWMSEKIKVSCVDDGRGGYTLVPFRYRIVANGGRSSPNKRPLLWDVQSRHVVEIPENGIVQCTFSVHGMSSSGPSPRVDSGWVHRSGTGAYQLRVDVPPGTFHESQLVTLLPKYEEPFKIRLYEAIPRDQGVPEGKSFACETYECARLTENDRLSDYVTYVMNAQSVDALEFGIDVVSIESGDVIAKGFVPVDCISDLEGDISVSLMSLKDFTLAGHFHATYLVVKELHHPDNTLCGIQRIPWSASAGNVTLDIGHRGSGASKVTGHSVRENTLLSFQKAALNHSDFIEFDVHLTSDNEVVVHHDFEVRLALGNTEIKMALPLIRSDQVRSSDFAQSMVTPSEHQKGEMIKQEKNKRESTLKRTMTSGEDMYRNIFYKPTHSMSPASPSEFNQELNQMRVFLSDNNFASLRQAFRMTPSWLGFNIELKYPTDEEKVAMGTRFYSRNFFVDAVLSTVLEEFGGRRVIFSTFDPACAELLRLKQCKFSVFFLTCGGSKIFKDPRMNSVEAALQFAQATRLHGVVAEISSIVHNLDTIVSNFHEHGLYLFTYGDMNNDMDTYSKQRLAGIDAIIMDDVARIGKAMNKTERNEMMPKQFSRNLRSPSSLVELCSNPSVNELQMIDLDRMASQINIAALSPIDRFTEFDNTDEEFFS